MKYIMKPMTRQEAESISAWQYPKPYDLYNMDGSEEGIQELLEEQYYTVWNEEEQLIGFFCLGSAAQVPIGRTLGVYPHEEGIIDVGLGMKPEMTGKGAGAEFFSSILDYVKQQYEVQQFRLTVASFNERARKVYERIGFTQQDRFIRGDLSFITMMKNVR